MWTKSKQLNERVTAIQSGRGAMAVIREEEIQLGF